MKAYVIFLFQVTNSQLALDDSTWARVSLLVNLGGHGVRSAVVVAPSASSYASAELINLLLPDGHSSPFADDALVLLVSSYSS